MKSIQREPSGFPFDLAKNEYDQNKVENTTDSLHIRNRKVYLYYTEIIFGKLGFIKRRKKTSYF